MIASFIRIKSESIHHLRHIPETLRKNEVYTNIIKLCFLDSLVAFLCAVNQHGISVDLSKASTIMNLHRTCNVKEVRVLCLASYNR
jgi:hypothetical protein